jgi:DNA-binding CsgD family transcriptional regulator
MRLDHKKFKALSRSILDLYRPMATSDLPRHFVSVLERAIPVEYLTYNDFQPETQEVKMVWNIEVPTYLDKLQPVFEKYMLENPLIEKWFKSASVLPAMKITDSIPQKDFQRTRVYNEFYRKVGVDFQMACAVSTRKSPFIALALNRKNRDFSSDEIFILNILREHLQHALESATHSIHSLMATLQRDGRGVLCFDGEYRARSISSMAEELALALWGCRPAENHILPDALKECVAKLMGNRHSEIPAVRTPLVFQQGDGSTVGLKLAFDPERSNHCLIFEREQNFTRPEQLKGLGLSPRETDVAYWIIQNKTNWEIGRILHISARTVDKHVENIFLKSGVNNRHHLIAKARELCDGY